MVSQWDLLNGEGGLSGNSAETDPSGSSRRLGLINNFAQKIGVSYQNILPLPGGKGRDKHWVLLSHSMNMEGEIL